MILLVHDLHTDASVAIAEGVVGGEHSPSRLYRQEGKYIVVEGAPHVMSHDVAELQRLGYRLASAKEQTDFAKQQKQASTLVESSTDEVKE